MPFEQLYLHYDYNNGSTETGAIGFVRLIGIIGVFVLLLACINFMNLSTARSEQRAKEVGIRKTIGSLRSQLIAQFLGESILLAAISFVLAILLAALSLPWFGVLSGKDPGISLGPARSSGRYPWSSRLSPACSPAATRLSTCLASGPSRS